MKERFGFGNCLYFGHLAINILPAILFYYKKQGRSYPNPCCKANNKYPFGYVYCRLKKQKTLDRTSLMQSPSHSSKNKYSP